VATATANTSGQAWPWPDSLDALVAAPQYHRLVMEDERVRVLETRIAPGQVVPLHTHRWPGVHYIVSWSDFVRRDEKGNVTLDTRQAGFVLQSGGALRAEPLTPHSVENVGTVELCAINFEIKQP